MDRITEINARLSAIATELETATGDALTALENEVNALTEERSSIEAEATRRQQLRSQVASGAIGIPSHVAPTAPTTPAPSLTVEQQEERSFADFIRGSITQMRTGEQNFNLANNGAVVPASIGRRIIEKVKDLCPILAGADIYHVTGTFKIPVYGAKNVSGTDHDITVAYGADFSELTADAGAFTSVDLTGYLIGALTLIGRSAQNNTDVDLVSFVINKMAEKIASFLEKELLVGTSGKMTGALSTDTTLLAGSISAITADNLIELQAKIPTALQANACWTMNPKTFTAIKKLKDGNSKYLIQDDFSGAFPYRLLGKPVYLSDNMPEVASGAKAVLYGDYSGMAVNIRESLAVEVLREKYATQHAIGVVAWMEADSKIQNHQKLATLVMSVSG